MIYIRNIIVLNLCTIFLTGCPIGKIVKEAPDVIPIIVQKIDETVTPIWTNIKKIFGSEDASTISKPNVSYFPKGLTHAIVRSSIRQLCNRDNTYACDEIASWEIPDDFFEEEPTYEDRISYFLSCVAIIIDESTRGTGFFVDKNILVTNHHVVKDKSEIGVIQYYDYLAIQEADVSPEDIFENGDTRGKVETKSEINDIAIIKTQKSNPTTCKISAISPELLEDVVTVGHPASLHYTVSKGNINAYRDKDMNFIPNINSLNIYSIHIDAPIYPGNSGGPLFYKGKVIGVNYGGMPDTTLNFSIHHNVLKRYLN